APNRFPSLEPVAEGSPVREWWGGFAAPCPKCGTMLLGVTAEQAALAAQGSVGHGVAFCQEARKGLSEAEREALEKLWFGASAKEIQSAQKPAPSPHAVPAPPRGKGGPKKGRPT